MDSVTELAAKLKKYNQAYRQGRPQVSDSAYDRLVEQLRELDPAHPFLAKVEPEQLDSKKEVRHPDPMLSIEKAYDQKSLERFVVRVHKEAETIGAAPVTFAVTPKLDGLAGRDDGRVLASRGNGMVGYDITSAFEKGVRVEGRRGMGLGEIVVVQSYFTKHLSDFFEHPRNMVVGIIASDVLNENARKALEDGAVRFVPYAAIPPWQGDGEQLLADIEKLAARFAKNTDYPTDGIVISVTDGQLRQHMGATSHHYRWQIAFKTKGETAESTVTAIQWQVGRTGSITPVLEIAPVTLSGATLRRVSAHHAGMIRMLSVGPGARIEVIRSGEVIPKLEKVIEPSVSVALPEKCPACASVLQWQGDFLKCIFSGCRAQVEQRIRHWFKTLGNADWFGIKSIRRILQNLDDSVVASDLDTLEKIYTLQQEDFVQMEFGPVQSKNLADAIGTSRTKAVEDWRFLAAFGIADLGVGDSRKLLANIPLQDLPKATAEQIEAIHGFGQKTSRTIAEGLQRIGPAMQRLLAAPGFNLMATARPGETAPESPVAGKAVVFTGKMVSGSRKTMEDQARLLGARVQSAVSSATDWLVCGEKVGARKLQKARRNNVTRLSEQEYLDRLDERKR